MLNKKALAASLSAVPATYVEDVFSTYLYTGNGSTQTINNGIDLSGEGGMLWCKIRNVSDAHALFDTARGFPNYLVSNATIEQNGYGAPDPTDMVATTSGFSMNNISSASNSWNQSGNTYVSWTFRKAEKFFDVVTYTGNGSTPRSISHNLGSVPGCVIIKCTSSTGNWITRHRSVGDTPNDMTNYTTNSRLFLNTTGAASGSSNIKADSTTFTVNHTGDLNTNGATYVAYLFAHDAGGFGDSGSESVIKCGSFTADGSGNVSVNLGYEPQLILYKRSDDTGNWLVFDNMRGLNLTSSVALYPNLASAEDPGYSIKPNATGFSDSGYTAGSTYIYIAVRRGPMKTPEAGTEVFTPLTAVPTSGIFQSNILTDSFWVNTKSDSSAGRTWVYDRLRGNDKILTPRTNNIQTLDTGTDAEATYSASTSAFQRNEDFAGDAGFTDTDYDGWAFKRAPGFMDIVCYTGNGTAGRTVSHNLGVTPELIIVKRRDTTGNWAVYANNDNTDYLFLNTTAATADLNTYWNDTSPTSSVFTVGTNTAVNTNAGTYIAYLFASLTGVSKVGSYTGNGSNQTINCGFTAGARFVMIKRINATGNWSVFDTARGIVSGNDPYVILNAPGTQSVSSTDSVDPDNSGFIVNQNATSNLNVNAATYIFFAIA